MYGTNTNEIGGLFGSLGLIGLIILGLLSLLIPLFIAGIYGSTRRIEKMLKQYIDDKPKRINKEIHDATHPFERREGSVYPEVKN